MGEQKELPFPYEFEELTPEEEALIKSTFGCIPANYIRLGPKGYMMFRPYKKDAANIYNMPLRPSDVFVASYRRSGTTVTQELVLGSLIWLIVNDLNYEKAAEKPLTQRFAFLDGFMTIDEDIKEEYVESIAKTEQDFDREKFSDFISVMAKPARALLAEAPLTSTRFIKTHLPMSLMPPKLLDTAKVVYVARDPRDDLPASIRRVADFFGKQLNEEQMHRLCDHLSIENFKNNKSVNFEETRKFGVLAKGETFIRKGKAGGWRAYFDEEMIQQADRWIEDNLRDTDLRYPNMQHC